MSTRWKWVTFDNGGIGHLVAEDLLSGLVADLARRGCPVSKVVACLKFQIDMPGLSAVDRPIEKFTLDGVTVEIPSEDIGALAEQLNALKVRKFDDGRSYFKMHGRYRAWVLTPVQHHELLTKLCMILPNAETRAKAFYVRRKPLSEVLREANAKANDVPVSEIPDCGGHKNDRFHKKDRR